MKDSKQPWYKQKRIGRILIVIVVLVLASVFGTTIDIGALLDLVGF